MATQYISMGLGIKKKIKHLLAMNTGKGKEKNNPQPARLQIWSIGIYEGESPYTLSFPAGVVNPVLTCEDVTDIDAVFVADPFMIRQGDIWHMFFEVLNKANKLGEVGHAISGDGIKWEYQRIVLREPFHLSYPYIFEWQNDFYMIPESWRGGGIRLYKAARFPDQWTCIGTLMEGGRFADSSIFRHENRWWLLTEMGEKVQSPVLRLFMSESLLGSWHEHPMSPVVESDPHIARPCGRIIKVGERLIRFAQDVFPVYGTQVYAFEITELTPHTYQERRVSEAPVLKAGASEWNNAGMHHIDAHHLENGKWRACVDGFTWRENTDG